MNVVAILNERSVEHYAENIFRFVVKHNFSVATHRKRHLLLFCESKNYWLIFFCVVSFIGGVYEGFSYVHTIAVKNFKKRSALTVAHVWNLIILNPTKTLDCGRFYNFFVVAFEVVNIPELAGLAYTFAVTKSSLAIKFQGVVNIIKKATKK